MRFLPILAAASLGLAGCSAGQDKAAAEAGVERFRQALAAGRYAEIYRTSGPDFRTGGSEAQAVQFLQTVNERLGPVRSASQSGWHFNYNNGRSTTKLNYNTEFTRGRGTEEFLFEIAQGRAILIGYHIDSNELRAAFSGAAPAAGGKPQ